VRRLRATPGFTLVSIGTLALGLGATSAIFSVINGVLLKPLPYTHPEQLVSIWMTAPGVKITDLNMAPAVYFASEDDDPDGERTVMISGGYWRSRFVGNRAVLGRRINIEGNQASIISVLPPSFEFMDEKPDLLLPLRFKRSSLHLIDFSYMGIGRLKPGVTIRQASTDLARMLPMVVRQFPIASGFHHKNVGRCPYRPQLAAVEKRSGWRYRKHTVATDGNSRYLFC
jgi:putative ABC transport system permease protein